MLGSWLVRGPAPAPQAWAGAFSCFPGSTKWYQKKNQPGAVQALVEPTWSVEGSLPMAGVGTG